MIHKLSLTFTSLLIVISSAFAIIRPVRAQANLVVVSTTIQAAVDAAHQAIALGNVMGMPRCGAGGLSDDRN